MKKVKISFIINILIFLMTVFASIVMFTGFKFMPGNDIILQSSSLGMFRFFTVDSNLFMGCMALIYSVYEYNYMTGKKKNIDKEIRILKYMATVGVSLTCLVVFVYLGPITNGGIAVLLKNANLFFHLIIPVVSVINFVFFEKSSELKLKDTLFGLVPVLLYGLYYVINIIIHTTDGMVSPIYDWYHFV